MTSDTFNIDGIFGDPAVIKDGNQYVMYYGAIWHAASDDGLNWQKDAAPILTRGDSASWTGQGISAPSVLVDGGQFRMWYTGTLTDFTSFFESGIGLAEKFLPTSVDDEKLAVPIAFALSQNYPNPFNPQTTIQYQLANDGRVTLGIYNLLGQPVRTLVNENKSAGSYSVIWDGKNKTGELVASGVYFYKLKIGDSFLSTRKMLYLE